MATRLARTSTGHWRCMDVHMAAAVVVYLLNRLGDAARPPASQPAPADSADRAADDATASSRPAPSTKHRRLRDVDGIQMRPQSDDHLGQSQPIACRPLFLTASNQGSKLFSPPPPNPKKNTAIDQMRLDLFYQTIIGAPWLIASRILFEFIISSPPFSRY